MVGGLYRFLFKLLELYFRSHSKSRRIKSKKKKISLTLSRCVMDVVPSFLHSYVCPPFRIFGPSFNGTFFLMKVLLGGRKRDQGLFYTSGSSSVTVQREILETTRTLILVNLYNEWCFFFWNRLFQSGQDQRTLKNSKVYRIVVCV